jgi:hypothetical protein
MGLREPYDAPTYKAGYKAGVIVRLRPFPLAQIQ